MLAGLLGLGMLLVNAALMMSDRAPGVLRRLSDRIDTGGAGASRLASDPRLPEGDSLVHIGVWAVAAILVGFALWSWIGLIAGGAVVFGGSLVVEYSQERFATTRTTQVSDVYANGLGVVTGIAVVACCYVAWSALHRLVAGPR